jgi:hypothetical protein
MGIRTEDDFTALDVYGTVVATARFRQHAAAAGNGAWVVSTRAARLLGRGQGDHSTIS